MATLRGWRGVVLSTVLTTVLMAVAACGGDGADTASTTPTPDTGLSTAGDPTPSATPWAALPGLGRCGLQPPRLAGQQYRKLTLRSPGRTLPAVVAGQGRTVVVLLHQTDAGGFCGWLDFAERIASVPGQAALAFDLCGYADAECADADSSAAKQVEQVRLAIDAATERLHARRIVLVGASMGGSLAVLTAARDARVDAAVDLSGPDDWRGAVVQRQAVDVRVPLLVAMADGEGADQVAAARATADAAGPGSEFVEAASGHGYELLVDADGSPTPIAERVLAWIVGD